VCCLLLLLYRGHDAYLGAEAIRMSLLEIAILPQRSALS
jgi:hypothetical protein